MVAMAVVGEANVNGGTATTMASVTICAMIAVLAVRVSRATTIAAFVSAEMIKAATPVSFAVRVSRATTMVIIVNAAMTGRRTLNKP